MVDDQIVSQQKTETAQKLILEITYHMGKEEDKLKDIMTNGGL